MGEGQPKSSETPSQPVNEHWLGDGKVAMVNEETPTKNGGTWRKNTMTQKSSMGLKWVPVLSGSDHNHL